jgi:redox-sensing transcriptional repressor
VFPRRGFRLVAAFDIAPEKIGRKIGSVVVRHVDELPQAVREHDVKLAILAVPADAAQEAARLLHEAGVQGILNFAPAGLDLPDDIAVSHVDLAAHLERLSFELSHIVPRPGARRPVQG